MLWKRPNASYVASHLRRPAKHKGTFCSTPQKLACSEEGQLAAGTIQTHYGAQEESAIAIECRSRAKSALYSVVLEGGHVADLTAAWALLAVEPDLS